MKRLVLLFTIIFLNFCYAQPYLPILEDGNAWSVDVLYCPFNPPYQTQWTVTQQITINGTVDINGVVYKQIYRDSQPSCLLREENGVVYKYDDSDNSEKILFDFNVEVGDVFFVLDLAYDFDNCSGGGQNLSIWYIEAFEIETLYIAGANRKVIKFLNQLSPQGGEVLAWIEGIGTVAGLEVPWPLEDVTCGSSLACFKNNGITHFMNGATSCDNTTLGLDSFSSEEIILYPNPVVNTSILQLPEAASIDLLKVFTINGKLIKEEIITKDHATIYHMDYASGLYFYQTFSENKLIKTEKFIVR